MDDRLAALERRVAALEARLGGSSAAPDLPGTAGTTLLAPLRVVDAAHHPLLEIGRDGAPLAQLFDRAGTPVVAWGVTAEGGYLEVRDAAGRCLCALTVAGGGSRVTLRHRDGRPHVELFGDAAGGGINISHPTEDGESTGISLWADAGGGTITVEQASHERIQISVTGAGDIFGPGDKQDVPLSEPRRPLA